MANLNLNATTESFAFAGGGAFYLADVDNKGKMTSGFTPMGLVDSAVMSIEATNIEKYDPSGGLNELFSKITVQQSGTMTFTVSEISYKKISDFLFGTYSETDEEIVADEEHTVKEAGTLITFGRVLKEGATVSVDTFEEGVHYAVDSSGIWIYTKEEQTENGATNFIEAGTVLSCGYTAAAMENIAGFTKSSNKKRVYFQGRSLDDGKDWIWEGYKLSFEPLSALPFVSTEDFATYELTAQLEKVSGHDSSFFELRKEL